MAAILISIGVVWDIYDYHKNKGIKQEAEKAMALKASGATIDAKAEQKIAEWKMLTNAKTPEEIKENIEAMHGGYFEIQKTKSDLIQWMQTWFQYRYGLWDILSFMLLGMAFFKLRILHAEKSVKFYVLLAFIG